MWKGEPATKSFLTLKSSSASITDYHRQHCRQYSAMKKLLCVCVVLVSSLLLVVTHAGASSSPPLTFTNSRHQQAQVLGRKGRELGQLGYRYQHEGKHMQQPQEMVMEVKKPVEKKAGWTDQGEDDTKGKGLIYSADYEGVALHAGSPPKHKHPKP